VRGLLVGGLGPPHDDLVAAALAAEGHDARPVGRLDGDALQRGRALLYTTGALLRAAAEEGTTAYVGLGSCGPCRYALFEDAWRRALGAASLGHVGIVLADLSPAEVHGLLGSSATTRVIAALLASPPMRSPSSSAACGPTSGIPLPSIPSPPPLARASPGASRRASPPSPPSPPSAGSIEAFRSRRSARSPGP
jgi:hypothetical protein